MGSLPAGAGVGVGVARGIGEMIPVRVRTQTTHQMQRAATSRPARAHSPPVCRFMEKQLACPPPLARAGQIFASSDSGTRCSASCQSALTTLAGHLQLIRGPLPRGATSCPASLALHLAPTYLPTSIASIRLSNFHDVRARRAGDLHSCRRHLLTADHHLSVPNPPSSDHAQYGSRKAACTPAPFPT
jgi:hypothetical protein